MKEQSKIPTTKVQRAARFLKTGAKIGGNYVKHYAKKAVKPDTPREELDEANAEDIYGALSELKGSALKMAQMMSMDKNVLPGAYRNQFMMAQYSAPPLSYPLVVKTLRQSLGDSPQELFDSFTQQAVNAASIGQVHQATKGEQTYAVKVQYPGVADSISSDLRLVRPIATRMFNLPDKDLDVYFEEVESKLLEEADYDLELRRSQEIATACASLQDVFFPHYYPELSGSRVITMDWLEGQHLDAWLKTDPDQEARNRAGQALWDFYEFQIHRLQMLHADPHPGNFLFRPDGTLGILDFGCVKELPQDFYAAYFDMVSSRVLNDEALLLQRFEELQFLYADDSKEERAFFTDLFVKTIRLLARPFFAERFDFSNPAYFQEIFEMGESLRNMKELRQSRPRGSRHGIYLNRTYFGLYNILHDLQAEIETGQRFEPVA